MHVYIWRCEHAVLCGNSHVSNFTHSFMPICIQMMPVILYLSVASQGLVVRRVFD